MMVSKKGLSNKTGVKKRTVNTSSKLLRTKLSRNQVSKKETSSNEIHTYAIRLKKGAKIIQSLEEFVQELESEIGFAEFSMIGSVEDIHVAFSLGHGKGEEGYHPVSLPESTGTLAKAEKTSPGQMELLPSWGNVTWKFDNPNQPVVHCHVSLANYENLQVFGGHLKEATVALTAEIILKVLSKEKVFKKKDDENTKVPLWDFSKIKNQIVINNKKMLVTQLSLKSK